LLDGLRNRSIAAPSPDEEHFYAGWVQQGRERGEQILMLCWRLPEERFEALVFLLDWRGDGLKDCYRTRDMTGDEWRQLVEHNGAKGAPLVALALGEGSALLEQALAESRRFGRPLPREYRLESGLIQRRVLDAQERMTEARSFITPEITPEEVVRAHIAALHFRDYALAAHLFAPEHPLRSGRSVDATVAGLRVQLKHAPRREAEVSVQVPTIPLDEAAEVTVEAQGGEVLVERSGRRIRHAVHDRYTVGMTPDGWRIIAIVSTVA
jgi:hypothetical protein